jgi:hypothetical protein
MRRVLLAAALFALAAPPAFAKLEVDKIEACYGRLGPARKTLDFYPYDEVYFRFTVTGAKADDDGNLDVEITRTLTDDKGKEVLPKKGGALKGQLSFGNESFPASVSVSLPEPVVAGEYTLKVKVKDNLSSEETSFEKKLNLKATEYAIVSPEFFHDAGHVVPAAAGGTVGQQLHFRLLTIGFDRSQGKIDSEMTVQVLDKDRKELLTKPLRMVAKKDDEKVAKELPALDFSGWFVLTRAGEFTLRVRVTDNISKKTATWEAPLKVTAP